MWFLDGTSAKLFLNWAVYYETQMLEWTRNVPVSSVPQSPLARIPLLSSLVVNHSSEIDLPSCL